MVTRPDYRLSILILTEDSARKAPETLEALLKRMLLIVDKACQTHRIRFEPQDEPTRNAMRGTSWKSRWNTMDRQKVVLLGRIVAAKLLEEEIPGFVVFHIDGDRIWSERATSENVEKFEIFVRDYVAQSVDAALRRRHGASLDDDSLCHARDAALGRLRRLTPFYSIEAWLYQNTAEARRLCEVSCGRHVEQILAWSTARDHLDEVHKPKEQLPCVGADHNHVLAATRFPSDEVFRADTSYAAAVMSLLDCQDLCAALAATYA